MKIDNTVVKEMASNIPRVTAKGKDLRGFTEDPREVAVVNRRLHLLSYAWIG